MPQDTIPGPSVPHGFVKGLCISSATIPNAMVSIVVLAVDDVYVVVLLIWIFDSFLKK
jgi:hypothetical protein